MPERLRPTATAPQEDFWDWRGQRVRLDRYPAPAAGFPGTPVDGVGDVGCGAVTDFRDTVTALAPAARALAWHDADDRAARRP